MRLQFAAALLLTALTASPAIANDHHRGIGEEPSVAVAPDYGPFDRITGYIKRTVQPIADDCRTPMGKQAVTITRIDWRWDASKKSYRKGSP